MCIKPFPFMLTESDPNFETLLSVSKSYLISQHLKAGSSTDVRLHSGAENLILKNGKDQNPARSRRSSLDFQIPSPNFKTQCEILSPQPRNPYCQRFGHPSIAPETSTPACQEEVSYIQAPNPPWELPPWGHVARKRCRRTGWGNPRIYYIPIMVT